MREERRIIYKGVETSRFKNFEGKLERENPKRTIYASGGLGVLQMVLEPYTERCARKKADLQKGWIEGLTTFGSEMGGL